MIENRYIIIDRDGTIIIDKNYLSDPDQIEFETRAIAGLRLMRSFGFRLLIVTNQSGVGRGYFSLEQMNETNSKLIGMLEQNGIKIEGIFSCPHSPDKNCDCRKPNIGLITEAKEKFGFKPGNCIVIGDKAADIKLGKNICAGTILVRTGYGQKTESLDNTTPDVIADNLEAAAYEIQSREL